MKRDHGKRYFLKDKKITWKRLDEGESNRIAGEVLKLQPADPTGQPVQGILTGHDRGCAGDLYFTHRRTEMHERAYAAWNLQTPT